MNFMLFISLAGGGLLKKSLAQQRRSAPNSVRNSTTNDGVGEERGGWWSYVIGPRDEFDGDGSIWSRNKKDGKTEA